MNEHGSLQPPAPGTPLRRSTRLASSVTTPTSVVATRHKRSAAAAALVAAPAGDSDAEEAEDQAHQQAQALDADVGGAEGTPAKEAPARARKGTPKPPRPPTKKQIAERVQVDARRGVFEGPASLVATYNHITQFFAGAAGADVGGAFSSASPAAFGLLGAGAGQPPAPLQQAWGASRPEELVPCLLTADSGSLQGGLGNHQPRGPADPGLAAAAVARKDQHMCSGADAAVALRASPMPPAPVRPLPAILDAAGRRHVQVLSDLEAVAAQGGHNRPPQHLRLHLHQGRRGGSKVSEDGGGSGGAGGGGGSSMDNTDEAGSGAKAGSDGGGTEALDPELRVLPNLGYACLCMVMRQYDIFNSRSCIQKTFKAPGGMGTVSRLALANARDLAPLIRWNEEHGIRLFRLSSNIMPWMTFYRMEELDDWPEIQRALREAGDLALRLGHRLTFHPSEFCKIAGERPQWVTQSVAELEVYSRIFDEMGFPPPSP